MLSFWKRPMNKYAFCSFGTLRTICLSITKSFSGHELKLGVRVNNTWGTKIGFFCENSVFLIYLCCKIVN
jgi:hypothetical protein